MKGQWKEDKNIYCAVYYPVLLTPGNGMYTQSTDVAISQQQNIFLPLELIFSKRLHPQCTCIFDLKTSFKTASFCKDGLTFFCRNLKHTVGA